MDRDDGENGHHDQMPEIHDHTTEMDVVREPESNDMDQEGEEEATVSQRRRIRRASNGPSTAVNRDHASGEACAQLRRFLRVGEVDNPPCAGAYATVEEEQEWRERFYIKVAKEMNQEMRNYIPTHVCAICGGFKCPGEVSWVSWNKIGHVGRLRLSPMLPEVEATDEYPRSGHTTYYGPDGEVYAILDTTTLYVDHKVPYASKKAAIQDPSLYADDQPLYQYDQLVTIGEESVDVATTIRTIDHRHGRVRVKMCTDCRKCLWLEDGDVPDGSFVRIDPGLRPPELEPLNLLESIVLSPLRPLRCIIVCRPSKVRGMPIFFIILFFFCSTKSTCDVSVLSLSIEGWLEA